MLKISSFYTSVPKTTIICGTFPEIWSETYFFVILGHFLPFTTPHPNNPEKQNLENTKKNWRCHHFKIVQQKTQSYVVCLDRHGV